MTSVVSVVPFSWPARVYRTTDNHRDHRGHREHECKRDRRTFKLSNDPRFDDPNPIVWTKAADEILEKWAEQRCFG